MAPKKSVKGKGKGKGRGKGKKVEEEVESSPPVSEVESDHSVHVAVHEHEPGLEPMDIQESLGLDESGSSTVSVTAGDVLEGVQKKKKRMPVYLTDEQEELIVELIKENESLYDN